MRKKTATTRTKKASRRREEPEADGGSKQAVGDSVQPVLEAVEPRVAEPPPTDNADVNLEAYEELGPDEDDDTGDMELASRCVERVLGELSPFELEKAVQLVESVL